MMAFRQLALEFVQRPTIRTACFAAIFQRNSHLGMGVPHAHIRHRAGEWQVGRGHFHVALRDVFFTHNYPLKRN